MMVMMTMVKMEMIMMIMTMVKCSHQARSGNMASPLLRPSLFCWSQNDYHDELMMITMARMIIKAKMMMTDFFQNIWIFFNLIRIALTWASTKVVCRMFPTWICNNITIFVFYIAFQIDLTHHQQQQHPIFISLTLKSRQLVPSLWQMTAFLLNIRVDALFFGRDILLGKELSDDYLIGIKMDWWHSRLRQFLIQCFILYLKIMPTIHAWIITPTTDWKSKYLHWLEQLNLVKPTWKLITKIASGHSSVVILPP